jgi:hypothetical protein
VLLLVKRVQRRGVSNEQDREKYFGMAVLQGPGCAEVDMFGVLDFFTR